jgi:flagellar motility protein MotE (MotC chaperone)
MKPRLSARLRLMPVVIALGAGLVLLKTSGLVHEAQAAEEVKKEEAAAHAPSSPADLAGPEDANASPAEVDILSTLSKRRNELDGRSRDLDMRANLLAATEKRVDDKIAQLKELQAQMTKLLNQRDAEQQTQVASLVKTYSSMKAKAAADIFSNLDDDVLVPVAQLMKSDVLAPILAAMPPAAAQRLTVKLANRLMLPKAPPAPPAALAPEASLAAPEGQITPAIQPAAPQIQPAQKQAALTPAEQSKPLAEKSTQHAIPAAKADPKPVAAAPKPVTPVKAEPAVKADAKAAMPAKAEAADKIPATTAMEAKTDAPAEAATSSAPAAPPAATIH